MKRSTVTVTGAVMLSTALFGFAVDLLGAGHGSHLFLGIAMCPFYFLPGGEYLALAFWVIVVVMLAGENYARRKVIRTMLGMQALSACGVTLWHLLGDERAPLLNVVTKRWWEVIAFFLVYATLLAWIWRRVDDDEKRREGDLCPRS